MDHILSTKKGKTKMPDSEAKKTWDKNNSIKITFKFMNKGDADILAYLDGHPKAATVKKAIRLLMEQEGFVYTPPTEDEE